MNSLDRREWLQVAGVSLVGLAARGGTVAGQDLLNDCEDCGGLGFLPLKNRRPYVYVEGMPLPKAADAVSHRYCPRCQPGKNDEHLVAEQAERLKTAIETHKRWERETSFSLVRIETRHVTVHAQMPPLECRDIGMAVENYAAHVQNLTGTMELTRSRPDQYEIMCLLGQPAFERFRSVMERLYTPEQRGETWSATRGLRAVDHSLIPFFYEEQQFLKRRPPAHGVAFMAGRKQLYLQTNYKAPRWLAEGYAEYSEYVALKKNLWHTVYNENPSPTPGDWVSQLSQLAAAGQLRPWAQQMNRDLRDYDVRDYLQTFGMVSFLIQSEPKKFLQYTRNLRAGQEDAKALETAYGKTLAQLEPECAKWIVTHGR
jgi:hypothetical protein